MNHFDASLICKAMADNHRLQILALLKKGEMCACKLLEHFEITQPTLSHHMRILCEANLVLNRKEGKWSHYQLNQETLADFSNFIAQMNPVEEGGSCPCGQ